MSTLDSTLERLQQAVSKLDQAYKAYAQASARHQSLLMNRFEGELRMVNRDLETYRKENHAMREALIEIEKRLGLTLSQLRQAVQDSQGTAEGKPDADR